jgi:adenylate cyclase
MSLVERFIEIQGWPTSRKLALVSAYVFGLSLVNFGLGTLVLEPAEWIDQRFWLSVGVGFLTLSAVMAALGWWVSRSHEGRWTLLVYGIPYAGLLLYFLWGIGPLTNAFFVLAPLSAIVVIVLFDDFMGRLASVVVIVASTVGIVVMAAGWSDYAPAIDDRSLDAGASPRVALSIGVMILLAISANLAIIWLVVAASRLTGARLDEAHRKLGEANRVIARYVPAEVAQDILEGRLTDVDGHHRRKLTVFFSDLVGFSDVAEELEPEDLARVLNEYFGEMTSIAHRHHGTVDELQGDALLILFGAPHATTDAEHAVNAVRMAAEMQSAMADLNARWRRAGITESLAVRIGINTGVVTVGNFGTPERMKYAALGKHVNIAARLQAIAEPGTTVLSLATYLLVQDEVECRELGQHQLKGINKPVEAFELA